MKIALVLPEGRPAHWSLREVAIPSIMRTWKCAELTGNISNRTFYAESSLRPGVFADLCSSDIIVFPLVDNWCARLILKLRANQQGPGYGIPFIFHTHGEAMEGLKEFELFEVVLRTCDAAIAASSPDGKAFRLCYPQMSVYVIPLSLNEGHRSEVAESPIPSIIYSGRICRIKRIDTLIVALGKLKAHSPDSIGEIHFFGVESRGLQREDLSYEDHLENFKRMQLKHNLNIFWHPWQTPENLLSWLKSHRHVFVSASLNPTENFGISALQSLLCGSLAVLSDWGGHRDLAKNFPDQVILVPTWERDFSPVVDPGELSRAIELALKRKYRRPRSPPKYYSPRAAAKKLVDACDGIRSRAKKGSANSLTASPLLFSMRRYIESIQRLRGQKAENFFELKAIQPFLFSYGMRKTTIKKKEIPRQRPEKKPV